MSVENFKCPRNRCIPIPDCESIADDYENVRSSNAEVKVTFHHSFRPVLMKTHCFQAAAVRKIKGLICDKKTKSICCPVHSE